MQNLPFGITLQIWVNVMPLVIEMQVKLFFANGVRNRMFGFGIGYFYVDMTSSIFSKKEAFGRYLTVKN